MSVSGLEHSEKLSKATLNKVLASLKQASNDIKQELQKVRYLLASPDQRIKWISDLADSSKLTQLQSLLNETELMYISDTDSEAARLFKRRTTDLLQGRLTNLQAYQTEISLKIQQVKKQVQNMSLEGFNNVKKDGALREMYSEAHEAGGFYTQTGKAYLNDVVTLQTKAAGSKTIGEYMDNLFTQYENKVNDALIGGLVRGESYSQMAKNLADATGISMRKAQLLINTESNAIFNESVSDVIKENPIVKGYRFRAVLDSRTSEICQSMDGKFIPKEDIKPGVNYPPLHPNCRSTVVTVLLDENELKDRRQRWTKNDNNEWEKVPPGMTYQQYKERFGFANSSKQPKTYEPVNRSVHGRTFAKKSQPKNVGYSKANRTAPERLDELMDLRIEGNAKEILEELDVKSIVEQALRETGYDNLPTVKTSQAFKNEVDEKDERYIVFNSEEEKENYKSGRVSNSVIAVNKETLDAMELESPGSTSHKLKVALRNDKRVAKSGQDPALTGERDRRYAQAGKEDTQVGKVIYMKYGYDAHDLGNGKTEVFNRTAVIVSEDEHEVKEQVVPTAQQVKSSTNSSQFWNRDKYKSISSSATRSISKDNKGYISMDDRRSAATLSKSVIERSSNTPFKDIIYDYTEAPVQNFAFRRVIKDKSASTRQLSEVVRNSISMLESDSTTVRAPVYVVRGTSMMEIGDFMDQANVSSVEELVDKEVSINNFIESTSLEETVFLDFEDRDVQVNILLPEGAKAVTVFGSSEESAFPSENEVAVIGGQKMKIVDVRTEGYRTVIDAVVDPTKTPDVIKELKEILNKSE